MNKALIATICRWTARVLGTVFTACVCIAFVLMPNPLSMPAWGQLIVLGLALIAFGLIFAWRFELAGGATALAGYLIGILPLAYSPRGLTPFYVILAVPALLFIASGWLARRRRHAPLAAASPGG